MKKYFIYIFTIGMIFWGSVLFARSENDQLEQEQEAQEIFALSSRVRTAIEPAVKFSGSDSNRVNHGGDILPLFGYDFFQSSLGAVDVKAIGLIPEDYLLGPGDRIGIFLLGKVQEQFDVTVSVEGKIFVPTAGIFTVLNLSLADFRVQLNDRLAKYYSNFTLELMVLTPKTIRVDVVGEVSAPGRYTLSSLNTVLDALLRAKGPRIRGSLRNIEIYRHDTLFTHVDIYDFFLNKDSGQRQYLQNGDRIHMPLVSARIAILGEVRRPGFYELNPLKQETFTDAIMMAGDFTDYAFLEKIELSRMLESGERWVQYVNFSKIIENDSLNRHLILKNDDQIRVYSRLDQINREFVAIYGEVKKPGEYELAGNMRLSDLILKAGNFTRSAYRLQAEVAKIDPSAPVRIIKVNLNRLFNDHDPLVDLLLEADDKVFIREIPEWQVGPMVELRGEVMFPGFYPINEDTTRLSQVIEMAGGFTNKAFIREASLNRPNSRWINDKEFERLKTMTREEMSNPEYDYFVMRHNAEQRSHIVVDFYQLFIEKNPREDIVLKANDIITIPKLPNVVDVTGRVGNPGGVIYQKGQNLKYYIQKAGGYAWDADKRRTKVIKAMGVILDDENVEKFEPGDQIWVPRKPERNYWNIIQQSVMVTAQIATIILVIQNARN